MPVDLPGAAEGAYELYVPLHVVDCLVPEESSAPREPIGVIERTVFRPDFPPTCPHFGSLPFPTGSTGTAGRSTCCAS